MNNEKFRIYIGPILVLLFLLIWTYDEWIEGDANLETHKEFDEHFKKLDDFLIEYRLHHENHNEKH